MSSETVTTFAQLGLAEPILRAVIDVGYESPSPIQAGSIPPLLAGRDLLGQAQTGTGKTAAFALPLLSRLDLDAQYPQLLVLTPTRELAIQVAEAMQTYARHLKDFHILPVYGGQGMDTQLRQLRRGVHVVVGTPGRVQDHLRRGTLKLDRLTSVVLDEADEMLRMGFIDDVEEILSHSPAERQIALFSATMPGPIRRIADNYLRDPVEIRIASTTTTVSTTAQYYWQVTGTHKLDALTRILEVSDFDAMLIFVRTKNETVELSEKLQARGYACAALNGDIVQAQREKTVAQLKNGKLDLVVATDVAARGLDVERISHVINYDIPYDTEAYVHRIGRTGRAGRSGEAILFVSPRERSMLRAIEKATRQPITQMQLPSHEDVTDRRIARFKQQITDTLEAEDLGAYEEVVNGFQREHNVGWSEIAAALAFLAQKDKPLMTAPEPRPTARQDTRFEYGRGEQDRSTQASARPPRERSGERSESHEPPEEGMERYRIEVGRLHGVQPKNIVGAIANEAGIESAFIGRIKMFDHFSLVDLPHDMPKAIFKHLKGVWVCGQQLNISRDTGGAPVYAPTDRPKPTHARKDFAPRKKTFAKDKPGGGAAKPRSKPRPAS
ncbi:MAG: DEAD/DEAH box helicase [Thiotrichales bacterium]